ncbi:protein yls3 [Phtheirospermum japonicum]|uniref:Protein yls3 n=1 Tax=Phtheirospermum japonicum TaxID=374723 RepID=A0A830D078_9LAMI|nr:protein yls3 [Phtheirospermum japonicum]
MGFSWTIAAVVTVAVVVAATGVAEGQSDCVAQLVTCAQYLNSTSPSRECCNAIQRVVSTQLPCLCSLYKNPQAFPGINITQALELPTHCNLPNDVSACDALAPGSSAHPPPGVPGRDGNGASMSSWMGMPTLVLVSAITFLY